MIEAVEGESRRRTCVLRGGPCGTDGHCDVHDAFFRGQEALLGALADTSLESLAARVALSDGIPERPVTKQAEWHGANQH